MKYILLFLLLPISFANELSFYTLGLSYHGKQITGRRTASKIPNKIDKQGNLTYHPELSVMYKGKFIYGATYLKNTFYNDAFMLSFGKSWDLFKYTQLGVLGSIYTYKKEPDLKEPSIYKTKTQGFILFPWAFVKQDIPVNLKTNLSFILTSNGFLTHLALGTTVKL